MILNRVQVRVSDFEKARTETPAFSFVCLFAVFV